MSYEHEQQYKALSERGIVAYRNELVAQLRERGDFSYRIFAETQSHSPYNHPGINRATNVALKTFSGAKQGATTAPTDSELHRAVQAVDKLLDRHVDGIRPSLGERVAQFFGYDANKWSASREQTRQAEFRSSHYKETLFAKGVEGFKEAVRTSARHDIQFEQQSKMFKWVEANSTNGNWTTIAPEKMTAQADFFLKEGAQKLADFDKKVTGKVENKLMSKGEYKSTLTKANASTNGNGQTVKKPINKTAASLRQSNRKSATHAQVM